MSVSPLGDDHAAEVQPRPRSLPRLAHWSVRREIEEHERLMRNRVADAIREGHFWAIVRAELVRDYSSLFDNIWRLESDIDRHFASTYPEPPAHARTGKC